MFTQDEADSDPNFFKDLEEDLNTECKKFGELSKVRIFERNPKGVVILIFVDHFDAVKCIEAMNGRYFAGHTLEADFYDGWSNYDVKETEEQIQKRIENFGKWIEGDEEDD
jgi:HIV Tat-specific factor 1